MFLPPKYFFEMPFSMPKLVLVKLFLLMLVFVFPHNVFSETLCVSPDQRNTPNANFVLRQCFAAIFERWRCFAIKSAAHTSSLNEGLINH